MTLRVLVLCTANAARSQMAEGWLRALAGERLHIRSAGARPGGLHPLAIRAMAERGIDIHGQRSKHLNEFLSEEWDWVLTVCETAAASCPTFPGPAKRQHWDIPDPAALAGDQEAKLAAFCAARDRLERLLREWLAALSGEMIEL